jgi:hypothetical protein
VAEIHMVHYAVFSHSICHLIHTMPSSTRLNAMQQQIDQLQATVDQLKSEFHCRLQLAARSRAFFYTDTSQEPHGRSRKTSTRSTPLIPKPAGQPGRNPPHGYKLLEAIGLADNKKEFNRLRVGFRLGSFSTC